MPRASWDFRVYNRGPVCCLLSSPWGLKDWQTGQRRARERQMRKRTVLVIPAVITPVMERSRAASAACCSTPSLAISQRRSRRLRKRLGETTQSPSAHGWSQTLVFPPRRFTLLYLLCYSFRRD